MNYLFTFSYFIGKKAAYPTGILTESGRQILSRMWPEYFKFIDLKAQLKNERVRRFVNSPILLETNGLRNRKPRY